MMAAEGSVLHELPPVGVSSPSPGYSEEVLPLVCAGTPLVGVLSLPASVSTPTSGVVIVVGGPQYRVGSHRQFVLLARRLAREGHAVLRFDVRGMGDSAGIRFPDFTNISDDIAAAVQGLQRRLPAVRSVVLWGLCDGASAALMYVHQHPDAPVAGLCLANPWVRSAATQAQATVKHYYKDRLRQRAFWVKLLKGGVAVRAVRELVSNLRQAGSFGRRAASAAHPARSGAVLPFQTRMALAWKQFQGPMLLLLSEHDYTAKEFIEAVNQGSEWQAAMKKQGLSRVDLAGTDHTCSDRAGRLQLEDATARWLDRFLAAPSAAKVQA